MKTMLLILALVTISNMAKASDTVDSYKQCVLEQTEIHNENADTLGDDENSEAVLEEMIEEMCEEA